MKQRNALSGLKECLAEEDPEDIDRQEREITRNQVRLETRWGHRYRELQPSTVTR